MVELAKADQLIMSELMDHVMFTATETPDMRKAQRDAGDEDKEKAYLDDIIQMYAWQNKDIRAVAEWLDQRYLNTYLTMLQNEVRISIIGNELKR